MNFTPQGINHRRLHKIKYYASRTHLSLLPHAWLAKSLDNVLAEYARLPETTQQHIAKRVNYYNKLDGQFALSGSLNTVGGFKKRGFSAYFYDLADYLRYFPADSVFAHEFGDVRDIATQPTLVKSRPIANNNQNNVILKLDSVRHFYIYPDPFDYAEKNDKLVWRGAAFEYQPHRMRFVQQFHQHKQCDIACIHHSSQGKPWHGAFMSVRDQLRHKFIFSIEGNDVATNLKWIMASNSLCFMTTPKYETWLMEGLLQPNVHYVHLQDDYADFDEKLLYYQNNPAAAQKIIAHAQAWMQPFFDEKQELITNLLVLKKYFEQSQA